MQWLSPVLNSGQNGRQTELPEQTAMLRRLKRGLHIYWARERGVNLFLQRDEPSESISRFSSCPCPSHSVKKADIKS